MVDSPGAGEPLDELVIRIETRVDELEDDMRRADRIVSETTRSIDTQTRQAGEGFVTLNQAAARAAITFGGILVAVQALRPALDTVRDLTIAFGRAAGDTEDAFERIERRIRDIPVVGRLAGGGVDALLGALSSAQRGFDLPGLGQVQLPELGGPLGFVQRAIDAFKAEQELGLQETLREAAEPLRLRGIDAARRLRVERGEIPESRIPEREFERSNLDFGNALLAIFEKFVDAGVDPKFAGRELRAIGRLGTAALAAERDLGLEGIEQERLARDPFQRFNTPFGQAAFATPQLGQEFISAAEQRRDVLREKQTEFQRKIEQNTKRGSANVPFS